MLAEHVAGADETAEGDAAISIIVGDAAPAPAALRGQVIRLSDTLSAAATDAATIYRYDRAALLGRLMAGQKGLGA